MIKKIILFFIVCIITTVTFAQENILQQIPQTGKNIFAFIPKGYDTLQTAQGDLNKDGKEDIAVVLYHKENEKEGVENTSNRLLLILLKSNSGYTLSAKTEKAIMCAYCGGTYGDPFSGLSIKKNVLTISHYGGSAWRWSYNHKFRLQNNSWVLIGQTHSYYWSASYCDKLGEHAGTNYKDENFVTGEYGIKEVSEEGCKLLVNKKGKNKVKPLLTLQNFDINKVLI